MPPPEALYDHENPEDVNGEKLTVKKWWIFGADFFAVYAELFTVSKGHINGEKIMEIPPGLLHHVLTVLVLWSWVLLLPQFPPWSRSLRLFPWASILLYGPLDIAWICCPQLPHHLGKNGTHSTCFYSTGGHKPRKKHLVIDDLFHG